MRREPTKLAVTIKYCDEAGARFKRRIVDDLRIYRDFAYVDPGELGSPRQRAEPVGRA